MSEVELGDYCLSISILLRLDRVFGVQIITRRYWKSGTLVEGVDPYKVWRRISDSVKWSSVDPSVTRYFSCLLN